MIRPPPRSTRTDTLFPSTTLFRSCVLRNSRGFVPDTGVSPSRTIAQHLLQNHRRLLGQHAVFRGNGRAIDASDHRAFANEHGLHAVRDSGQPPNVACVSPVTPVSACRSEERRVGIACVSTRSYRWSPYHK